MKLYRIFSDHYFDDRISPVFISSQWIDVASGYKWLLHHKSRESDPDGSEAWIFWVFFFFWIRLPVFNKWREQRNILNDTAGYSQQNPDYGQTTGQKIVSSLKKKIKEKKLQGKREIKWEGKHTLKEKGKTYQPIAIQRLFGFCFKHTRKNSKMTGEI